MTTTTAPAGRVYRVLPGTKDLAGELAHLRELYAAASGHPARWVRVNPADLDRFSPLWPGAVVADRRIRPNQVQLGVE